MKESYPEDIMLCFVQGFSDRETGYNKSRETAECELSDIPLRKKKRSKPFRDFSNTEPGGQNEFGLRRNDGFVAKSFRVTRNKGLPDVKRSFSDRFSVIPDVGGRKVPRGLLTIRKTWWKRNCERRSLASLSHCKDQNYLHLIFTQFIPLYLNHICIILSPV